MNKKMFAVMTVSFVAGFVFSVVFFNDYNQNKYAMLHERGIFSDGNGHPDTFRGQHDTSNLYGWGIHYTNEYNDNFWFYVDSRPVVSSYPSPTLDFQNARWADKNKLQATVSKNLEIHLNSKDTLQLWQQPVFPAQHDSNSFRWRVTWTGPDSSVFVFYTNIKPVSMWRPRGAPGEENILIEMKNVYLPEAKGDYMVYYIGGPARSFVFEEQKNGAWRPLK